MWALTLALLTCLGIDFSNPLLPGVVRFGEEESVHALRAERARIDERPTRTLPRPPEPANFVDVAGLALQEEWLRKRQKDAVTAFLAAHGKEPVGEVLRTLGVTLAPDFDVVAALSWPVVRSVCATAPVRGWLASLVAEFFDGVPDDAG